MIKDKEKLKKKLRNTEKEAEMIIEIFLYFNQKYNNGRRKRV